MKAVLTLGLVSLSIVVPTEPALAGTYGASNLGGSAYLTWLLLSDGSSAPNSYGYACVTRDALEGMARTADIARYRVFAPDGEFYLELEPLNAVSIYADESGVYRAYPSEPIAPDTLFGVAEPDEGGDWFADNMVVDEIGQACLDTGVAGAIQYLEQLHGIDVQE